MQFRFVRFVFACPLAVATLTAAPVFYTPSTSYVQASDSPFASMSFNWFYLNDFEANGLVASPGASPSAGNTSYNSGFSGMIVDSVDADDGSVNAICSKSPTCISWFAGSGSTGVTWTFDSGALGGLPTHAGIVWTDAGGGPVTFSAYGPGMVLLGTKTNADGGWSPGGSFSDGDVAEDHFFGVYDTGGILAITLSNASGGIEMDHLQYGREGQTAVPEPSTFAMGGLGMLALGLWRLRRR